MNDKAVLPQLILCVPGPWEDRSQFLQCLIEGTQGEYLAAGALLMHVATQDVFEVKFHSRDEKMHSAFRSAGPHWRDSADMARIGTHRSVVYLLGHGGSGKNIEALMLAARALLDAGGLGVKVESTGLAHAPDAWRRMCTELAVFSAYGAFVVVVSGREKAYSCGMHSFGMHDVEVVDDDMTSARRVANTFCWYLFTERPTIADGQTFSCDAQSPKYMISSSEGIDHGPDSLFANPYGTWRLRRL